MDKPMSTTSDTAVTGRLDLIPQAVCEALDLWSADIWALMSEGDSLQCLGSWSRAGRAQTCVGMSVALEHSGDLRRLVLAGRPLEWHADDPDLSAAATAALAGQGLKSRADLPLQLGDEVLGVLSLGERRAVRRLDDGERVLLRSLCDLAALTLRAEAQARAADERSGHLEDLVRSGRTMVESLRVQTTIAQAKAQALSLLQGVECAVEVALLKDDGSLARVVTGLGDEVDLGATYEAWPADALARQVARLRRRDQERARDGRTRLIVPLLNRDRCLGIMEVRAVLTRSFRRQEVELVQLLAEQVATALANARALRSMEERSATDSTTGLYGRWYFYERLAAEVARARRYGQPLSLLVIQVDDLDGVMAPGRPAGERVLREMASIVQGCLRDKVDVPCRHGMASFAVLLPSTMPLDNGAGLVAERLREVAAQTEVADDDIGCLGRFTLSIGVAGYPTHCDDADELAAMAEEAVHAARRNGGDQVVLADS
jgi:diguanylate cyclase (GGDEF)-like protein